MQGNKEHINQFTPPRLNPSNLTFIISMLLLFFLTISFSPDVEAKKKQKKDKIKVTVLQNTEYNECMFKDEVIISVKYRLRSIDSGALSAELTTDGITFFEATSVDIARGKGKIIMSFDAGECATDMRVVIK